MLVKAEQVERRLAGTERGLQFLLRAILPTTDSRFDYVSDLLHWRVWKTWDAFPNEEEFEFDGDMVYNENWFLPVVLLVPTIIGMITQNKFIKQSHKWEL